MRMIKEIDNADYTQWAERLTIRVILDSKIDWIHCRRIMIKSFNFGEMIDLEIDGTDYTITVWNLFPLDYDKKGRICEAVVGYTLFMIAGKDDGSSHSEMINRNSLVIEW